MCYFCIVRAPPEEEKEVRKIVKFADGICPGEGTSPSGGEDLPSPPPPPKKLPKEKRYQKKLKNKNKKKIKVTLQYPVAYLKLWLKEDLIHSLFTDPAVSVLGMLLTLCSV